MNSPAAGVLAAPAGIEDIESLRHRREEAERRVNELNGDVKDLEEILRTQTHPSDLAVIRKSGTRVLSKPSQNGPVLFLAEGEDEFQILDSGPDWVHVQISGASRGWIRRSDLSLPEGLNENSSKAGATSSPFQILREETNAFPGNWEPLHGKPVKIIWAGPSSTTAKPASGLAKQRFAKSLLATASKEFFSHDSELAGVVIVFDSADGGQIAATAQNLKQWQAGNLSDDSFWQLCSVDPADFFNP